MGRTFIFRIRSSRGLLRWAETFGNPEPLKAALCLLRGKAFGFAASGKHGDYPYDDEEGFSEAVENGFSDDGASWEALDGTVISFAPAEDVPAALVLTAPGAGFRPEDDAIAVIGKAAKAGTATFSLKGDGERGMLASDGDTAVIERPAEQKYVISKLAEAAVARIGRKRDTGNAVFMPLGHLYCIFSLLLHYGTQNGQTRG